MMKILAYHVLRIITFITENALRVVLITRMRKKMEYAKIVTLRVIVVMVQITMTVQPATHHYS